MSNYIKLEPQFRGALTDQLWRKAVDHLGGVGAGLQADADVLAGQLGTCLWHQLQNQLCADTND